MFETSGCGADRSSAALQRFRPVARPRGRARFHATGAQVLCAALLLVATHAAALAAGQVALVIGNSSYQHVSALRNPGNDAADIAGALRNLGFEVLEGHDLKRDAFLKIVEAFASKAAGADVALFFYAGHGLQAGGTNYLIPIDAALRDNSSLKTALISVDLILRHTEGKALARLVFLDACRDNPFGDAPQASRTALGRGLAVMASAPGTLIAFATEPNNTASDGTGRNSPFTRALLNRIAKPGTDISDLLRRVTRDVISATNGQQVPWNHSSLTQGLVFSRAQELRRAAIHACDRLAAHPEDGERVVEGVPDEALKASDAAAACRTALAAYPGVSRFEYQLARALSAQKKDADAFPLFLSAGVRGYTQAYMDIVRAYYFGAGVGASLDEALKWTSKAAANDDARTSLFTGVLLQELGRDTRTPEAIKLGTELIHKAAELEHLRAMLYLGALYEFGTNVEKSPTKAAEWYRRAAERGDPVARTRLAGFYLQGLGVPKDTQQALHLLDGAIKSGDALAMAALAIAYQKGVGVERNAPQAAHWFEESAKRGNATAMYALSYIYRDGKGVPQDHAAALRWLTKSAEANETQGMFSLGKAQFLGELGLKTDEVTGAAWFKKAAEKGDPLAMFALGLAYDRGQGVPADPAAALPPLTHKRPQGPTQGQGVADRRRA